MKKLMIAAAAAAMVGGASAECFPDEEIEVARVYQVQMNVCTTKGVYVGAGGGSACEPGDCVVMRGKDTTILRGYLYICENVCWLGDYACVMADAKRKAIFEDPCLEWSFINIIGANGTDAECRWDFCGYVCYDEVRGQDYQVCGAGYGVFKKEGMYFDDLSGNFTGSASASFDLGKHEVADDDDCFCTPSQVLLCEDGAVEFQDSDTVAFGTWKIKYSPETTKAMMEWAGGEESFFSELLKKVMK